MYSYTYMQVLYVIYGRWLHADMLMVDTYNDYEFDFKKKEEIMYKNYEL